MLNLIIFRRLGYRALRSLIRMYCVSGIVTQEVEINGIARRMIEVNGVINKRKDLSFVVKTNC